MSVLNVNRIILSGGWGYGNLGDDAILVSTVKLVRSKYPNAEIIIMSYDPEETKRNEELEDIKILPSIHKHLLKNVSGLRHQKISDPSNASFKNSVLENMLGRVSGKINKLLYQKTLKQVKANFNYFRNNLSELPEYETFKNSDLFIMAGGGYFNDGWIDSFYSHLLELHVTHSLNIKTVFIGQTIGPFLSGEHREMALKALKQVNKISVRDDDSFNEFYNTGIKPHLTPDVVLSETIDISHQPIVCIVVGAGGMASEVMNEIALSMLTITTQLKYSVKILVSRTWKNDVRSAMKLYSVLKKKNINSEFVLPNSYNSLQKEIGECSVLISQNLHGLILGWRAGVPCISLSTSRKFIAFMNQSNQGHRIMSAKDIKADKLSFMILDIVNEPNHLSTQGSDLAKSIQKDYFEYLSF